MLPFDFKLRGSQVTQLKYLTVPARMIPASMNPNAAKVVSTIAIVTRTRIVKLETEGMCLTAGRYSSLTTPTYAIMICNQHI